MNDNSLTEAIFLEAHRHNIPETLLHAIVKVESSGNIYAWRAEPKYRYLWDIDKNRPFRKLTASENDGESAPSDFTHYPFSSKDTEWWGQQASWGPMQVMGAVARECGFKDHFPALCAPAAGIAIGTIHLATLKRRFFDQFGWLGVVAAFNAGSPRRGPDGTWVNSNYVNKVRSAGGLS